jgi:hypothetical protein
MSVATCSICFSYDIDLWYIILAIWTTIDVEIFLLLFGLYFLQLFCKFYACWLLFYPRTLHSYLCIMVYSS